MGRFQKLVETRDALRRVEGGAPDAGTWGAAAWRSLAQPDFLPLT